MIAGAVKIDGFTMEKSGSDKIKPNTNYTAVKHPGSIIKDTDDACVLTPRERNLHQISCVEGPAAFLDILSPPYDVDEYGNGTRPCTFFRITGSIRSTESDVDLEKVSLVSTESPSDFYSRSLKYLGPPLR